MKSYPNQYLNCRKIMYIDMFFGRKKTYAHPNICVLGTLVFVGQG